MIAIIIIYALASVVSRKVIITVGDIYQAPTICQECFYISHNLFCIMP